MISQIYVDLPLALQIAARLLMALLCSVVIIGSICRIAAMHAGKTHKWAWALAYLLYAAAAGDMLIYIAQEHAAPPDAAALAVTALAANIVLTRPSWRNRPPKITERDT